MNKRDFKRAAIKKITHLVKNEGVIIDPNNFGIYFNYDDKKFGFYDNSREMCLIGAMLFDKHCESFSIQDFCYYKELGSIYGIDKKEAKLIEAGFCLYTYYDTNSAFYRLGNEIRNELIKRGLFNAEES